MLQRKTVRAESSERRSTIMKLWGKVTSSNDVFGVRLFKVEGVSGEKILAMAIHPPPAVNGAPEPASNSLPVTPTYTEPDSAAGTVLPQVSKEDTQDELGTMTHMQLALQKVEHEKLVTNARAWEESAKARIANRSARDEAKIAAWETSMKAKAEARLRKAEASLEKQKAKYLERMKNEIAGAHKTAEERRAMVEAKKGHHILKAEDSAAKILATGIFPKKFGCFSA